MEMPENMNRKSQRQRRALTHFAILVTMTAIAAPRTHASVSSHAVFRQVRWPDRGSVHALLHNRGSVPVRLVKLSLNGQTFEPSASGFTVHAHLDELVDDLLGDAIGIPHKRSEVRSLLAHEYLPRDTKPGEVLWYWAPTYALKPGDITELVIKFSNTPQERIDIQLLWSDGQETTLAVMPVPTQICLSALAFATSLDTVFAYVHNSSNTPVEADGVWLNGRKMEAERVKTIGFPVAEGSTGAVIMNTSEPLRQGDWCYMLLNTREGDFVFGSARALTGFPVLVLNSGVMNLNQTYSQPDGVSLKGFGDISDARLDVIAERITRNRAAPGFCSGSEYLSLLVSQPFIKYASAICGELVDCASLNLQPSGVRYLGPFNDADAHYVQAKARYLRECFAPRPVFGHIIIAHCYMATNCKGLLRPEELRLRCYYMLSRGIRGILYRDGPPELAQMCTKAEREALKDEMLTLGKEFSQLRPYARIAESAERLATCTEHLVEPAALLAGDRGLVLILLNHDRQQSWPKNEFCMQKSFFFEPVRRPFHVSVQVPQGLIITTVEELKGEERYRVPFAQSGGNIAFDVPGLHATRQYILAATETSCTSTLKSPEYPVRRQHGPKAAFPRKQVFLGRVAPSTEGYKAVFTCHNDGDAPLVIRYRSENSSWASMSPDHALIEPGKSATFTAVCAPVSSVFHEVLRLDTNDPCCPSIRLDIGGEIVPEIRVSPASVAIYPGALGANIVVLDSTGGKRRVVKATVTDKRLALAIKEKQYPVDYHPTDVYSARNLRHVYEICVTPDQRVFRGRWQADVVLDTDSRLSEYQRITVPVTIMGSPVIEARPKSVFLFAGEEQVEQCVRLVPDVNNCVIAAVEADHSFISASVAGQEGNGPLTLNIRCQRNGTRGIIKGAVKITVRCEEAVETITVPYVVVFP